jgi:hypothetical protein
MNIPEQRVVVAQVAKEVLGQHLWVQEFKDNICMVAPAE